MVFSNFDQMKSALSSKEILAIEIAMTASEPMFETQRDVRADRKAPEHRALQNAKREMCVEVAARFGVRRCFAAFDKRR